MNQALPSKRMSLTFIKGAKDLSMRMECSHSFFVNAPLVGHSSRKKCHSKIGSLLWSQSSLFSPNGVLVRAIFEGGGTREEIQEHISFCLGEFLPKPLTFKEATVSGLLFMRWLVQGRLNADRFLWQEAPPRTIFVSFPFEFLQAGGSGGVMYDHVGSLRTPQI